MSTVKGLSISLILTVAHIVHSSCMGTFCALLAHSLCLHGPCGRFFWQMQVLISSRAQTAKAQVTNQRHTASQDLQSSPSSPSLKPVKSQ